MRALIGTLLLAALSFASLPDNVQDLPTTQLVELATKSIHSDPRTALDLYAILLQRQPDDISTMYKAASVSLSIGQYSKAKQGFENVLELNPNQHLARLQLAKLHAKLAEYQQAQHHLDKYSKLSKDSSSDDDDVKQLKSDIHLAKSNSVKLEQLARKQFRSSDECLSILNQLVNVSPYSVSLRLQRSACAILPPSSDFTTALADIGRAASLDPNLSSDTLVKAGILAAFFVDDQMPPTEYQAFLKRCLAADPDNKQCASTLRQLKRTKKELDKLKNWRDSARWNEAVVAIRGPPGQPESGLLETVERLIKQHDESLDDSKSPVTTMLVSTLCKAYVSLGNSRKASEPCKRALERNPEDAWALVSKAADAEKEEQWDAAVAALSKAFEASGRTDRDILARLQRAQKLLKQSKTKDYYKVLGVPRDADEKQIKRAYRKGTLKAHPDKEGGSQERMAALNEAYGVLSDPQLRARYDAGDDPNDPASGQQGGAGFGGQPFFFHGGGGAQGNPFQFFQQFQQQGGGGGGFGGFPGGGSFKVQFG